MAETLGVGRATIARDVSRIRAEWRQERLQDLDEVIAGELAKLDLAESVVIPVLLEKDPAAPSRLLAIMARRAAMLGLDYDHGVAERQVRIEEQKVLALPTEIVVGCRRPTRIQQTRVEMSARVFKSGQPKTGADQRKR